MIGLGFKKILVGASILSLSTLPASAANLLNTIFAPPQTITDPDTLLAVFPSGSFTQSFTAPEAETVMLSFSAVCSISGTGNQALKIKITLDSQVLYPTNKATDVLCSAAGANTNLDSLSTVTVMGARSVGSGNHNLQVRATPTNGGTGRIVDLGILVWD